MRRILIVSAVFLHCVLGALCSKNSNVVEVRSTKFTEEVLYHPHVVAVMFYSPYCGYCKSMAPDWEKAAKKMKGVAKFAAVDCTLRKNEVLCKRYGITGYPTIQMFQPAELTDTDLQAVRNGSSIPKKRPERYKYNSQRDSEALISYVKSKIRNYAIPLNPTNFKSFINSSTPKLLLLQNTDSKSIPLSIKALSRDLFGRVDVGVATKSTLSLWSELNLSVPKDDKKLIFINPNGENKVFSGKLDIKRIKQFVKAQLAGPDPAKQEL